MGSRNLGYADKCRSCRHWSPCGMFEGKPVQGVGMCGVLGREVGGKCDACAWHEFRSKAYVKPEDRRTEGLV